MSVFSRDAIYHPSSTAFLTGLLLSGGFGVVLGVAILVSPLLSVVLLAVFALVYHLALYPFRLSYLLLGAIIFTSAIPRHRIVPILKVNEIVLILALGWLFIPQAYQHRRSITFPGTLVAALAILALGTAIVPLIAYLLRGFALSTNDILGLIAPLQYLCLFYFFALFPKTEAQRHRIIQFMWFLASVVAVIGLLQALHVGPVVALLNRLYPSTHTANAAEVGRVTSIFGAWNALGTFLMTVLVMAMAFQQYSRTRLYRFNMRMMVLLVLPCLLATNFYSGLIGLSVGFVIVNLIRPLDKRVIFLVLLFVIVAVIVLWPLISVRIEYQFDSGSLVPQTIHYRLQVWEKFYLPLIQRDFLWGGAPNFDNIIFAYAESQYLFLALHAGMIALVSHLVWVVLLAGWLFGTIQHGPELSRNLGVTAFTLVVVYSLMGITNPVFTYSGSLDFFWISLGLIVSERV